MRRQRERWKGRTIARPSSTSPTKRLNSSPRYQLQRGGCILRASSPPNGGIPSMTHYICDLTGRDLAEPEATVLVIRGPLRSMLGRSRIELGKPAALALARWLDPDISRPELESIPG